jgi:hypothetical protein
MEGRGGLGEKEGVQSLLMRRRSIPAKEKEREREERERGEREKETLVSPEPVASLFDLYLMTARPTKTGFPAKYDVLWNFV